ncbi:putative E3 ubiquitin-protein ligase HECTD2 [Ixodes scapularis]
MDVVGERREPPAGVPLTCPACRISVVSSRSRAMCPFCGSFYNRDANSDTSLRGRQGSSLPHIESHRPLVRVTGFGPLITDSLGAIHTYITGLILRPTSPNSSLYLSLPAVQPDAERRLCTMSAGAHMPSTARPASSASATPKDLGAGIYGDATGIVAQPHELASEPEYPVRHREVRELREIVEEGRASSSFSKIQEFYEQTFSSLIELNALFKENPRQDDAKLEDPEIKNELLHAVYDMLEELPTYVSKAVLKGIINSLLATDIRLKSKDDTRAVYILLQNPIFSSQSSYTVFAHLLRRVVSLKSADHQLLIHWFSNSPADRLRGLVKRLLQFITIREFPPANGHKLPSISKSRWWIPCATRVLALINAANNKKTPNILNYTDFYNSALDHIDLMSEYYRWQSPGKHSKFSYCQYPFILSIVAKKSILQRDSEQQMILNARRSLLNRALHHQAPDIDVFFLNLNVRRSYLVSDSLNEIARKQTDLKKKLKVTFVACYKKLLNPPVVPHNIENANVGICKFTTDDLAEVMPDVAVGLKELLSYEGNVEEDFCMNFQVSVEEFGEVKTHTLKVGGEDIPVTSENRNEYVDLYVDLVLNKAIAQPFKAFYLGFHSVCASNALIMLRPEEVEMLVCGCPKLDLEELRKVTIYDNFDENEPIIRDFWDIVISFSPEVQKQFLRFATGSDRVPVGGMGEMTFKISSLNNNTDMLPVSHTCFNQLVLPKYKSKDVLREKLIIAISNAEGFGLE